MHHTHARRAERHASLLCRWQVNSLFGCVTRRDDDFPPAVARRQALGGGPASGQTSFWLPPDLLGQRLRLFQRSFDGCLCPSRRTSRSLFSKPEIRQSECFTHLCIRSGGSLYPTTPATTAAQTPAAGTMGYP